MSFQKCWSLAHKRACLADGEWQGRLIWVLGIRMQGPSHSLPEVVKQDSFGAEPARLGGGFWARAVCPFALLTECVGRVRSSSSIELIETCNFPNMKAPFAGFPWHFLVGEPSYPRLVRPTSSS